MSDYESDWESDGESDEESNDVEDDDNCDDYGVDQMNNPQNYKSLRNDHCRNEVQDGEGDGERCGEDDVDTSK